MKTVVQMDSCERIISILEKPTLDKVALYRECESPRAEIESKMHWVCFEAEMKVQIWESQQQTYQTLMENEGFGGASQLNMGEGKTQTIIPMITLELLYGKRATKMIPRINLLNSLMSESMGNFFRFLSITAFNIPIVEFPFDRGVEFDCTLTKRKIQEMLQIFSGKMMLMMTQSSVHSLILKLREETIKANNKKLQKDSDRSKIIFNGAQYFDIFDEVDAQMHPRKSFVYSIGSAT